MQKDSLFHSQALRQTGTCPRGETLSNTKKEEKVAFFKWEEMVKTFRASMIKFLSPLRSTSIKLVRPGRRTIPDSCELRRRDEADASKHRHNASEHSLTIICKQKLTLWRLDFNLEGHMICNQITRGWLMIHIPSSGACQVVGSISNSTAMMRWIERISCWCTRWDITHVIFAFIFEWLEKYTSHVCRLQLSLSLVTWVSTDINNWRRQKRWMKVYSTVLMWMNSRLRTEVKCWFLHQLNVSHRNIVAALVCLSLFLHMNHPPWQSDRVTDTHLSAGCMEIRENISNLLMIEKYRNLLMIEKYRNYVISRICSQSCITLKVISDMCKSEHDSYGKRMTLDSSLIVNNSNFQILPIGNDKLWTLKEYWMKT